MGDLQGKGDIETKREMQMASLRHDISTAPKLKDLVLYELNLGSSPEWVATKYGHLGATLERVTAFKAALDRQREIQRERQDAARGNQEAPEVREESDAA